ncbi:MULTISPECIES: glycosyltransferase [unclassified Paenibacillus]|uniref:glycosyltransferase n=1 Tax=unclassified Paenibacillus TaxID=185978 RepID=UPI0024061BC3|nr:MULTISPECIES: glycosyltransferase [unclassified Paenibacillus]MDF9844982.1 teichuronic acid biosynthesis glycosyltransferase TuaG [Paenibacillus sp. PastF-2]MDF9851581.1 teichuronic acid biosynthesis glycosyltransferase TuaG [Paenibacillus sp. PastM-2]MDF9858165.1 teichuronic acid biosynthesis glycosyltransferase TuaG [Paenibacillus sp. PastF-1]MDH6483391.1 teichuronic acid biosynthesis glycosyltransferase TuaG [Paenibacillus sp. PastH-2]MDH6510841.1 teichuronic acid biosynthesis glycosyltr
MKPKVSIIIPFYNCPYVELAIRSALAQTYQPLEIIVVDDGSTLYFDKIRKYGGRVCYLGKPNGGTASALNHGIRNATGDYIAWLSSDDFYKPGKIERQIQLMTETGAYISHTNFNFINGEGLLTKYAVASAFPSMPDFYRALMEGNPVNGCTVMIRREMFAQIGLFDESLPYTHDLDFWYRAVLAGYSFPFLNETLLYYRWHDGMGTRLHHDEIKIELAHVQANYRDRMEKLIARS